MNQTPSWLVYQEIQAKIDGSLVCVKEKKKKKDYKDEFYTEIGKRLPKRLPNNKKISTILVQK